MMLAELNPAIREPGILVFDCPCGKCGGRIRVSLAPERDARGQSWNHFGCVERLTLSPSVGAGCWHGHIVEGEITA